MRPHFGRSIGSLACITLLTAACITVLSPAGPAAAAGTRAWTDDFGLTPDVFSTPASPSIPVGGAVPANVVIIDNDPSCVGPSFSACVQPTGTVTVTAEDAAHNVTTLGSSALSSVPEQPGRSGEAVFSFPATLAPGTYIVEASYSGDSTFSAGGVLGALELVITQATPTVKLTQSHATTHPGSPFSVTAAVTYPSTAAAGDPLEPETPTGSITLSESGAPPATLPLGTAGTATFSIAGPVAVGDLTFHASYSGDTDIMAGTSSALTHHVTPVVTTTAPPPSSSSATSTSASTGTSTRPAGATSSSSGDLADTGVRTAGLLIVALALLVAGGGVLAGSRRPSRNH